MYLHTYLRLSGKQVGLLINFNVPVLKTGIRRCILSKKEYHRTYDLKVSDFISAEERHETLRR